MTSLEILIDYWKQRQQPHPPVTPLFWGEVLFATIHYLTELQKLKKGEK